MNCSENPLAHHKRIDTPVSSSFCHPDLEATYPPTGTLKLQEEPVRESGVTVVDNFSKHRFRFVMDSTLEPTPDDDMAKVAIFVDTRDARDPQ
ncbi:hypothetical protein RB195_015764 [Necator americanus]|uniref:Uncharacterized protein n=1 Tax=Necator americanus TaxID=51031 RepID=A0ABR1E628_NECAM